MAGRPVNLVNLNRARKARARDESRRQADANAAKFGRSKAERARDAAETWKADRDLDGHRTEPEK